MRTTWLLTGLMAIGAAGCASNMAKDRGEAGEHDEVKVDFAQVPPAAKAVLTREANGNRIDSVDKETLDGKVVYEADVMVDGQNREIVVGADGMLVHNKVDSDGDEAKDKTGVKAGAMTSGEKDEEDEKDEKDEKDAAQKMTAEQLPAAVRATLMRETAGATMTEIGKETEDGKTVFEAKSMMNGKPYELKVDADGTLLEKKLEDEEENEDEGKDANKTGEK